jgi:hypothetical protein
MGKFRGGVLCFVTPGAGGERGEEVMDAERYGSRRGKRVRRHMVGIGFNRASLAHRQDADDARDTCWVSWLARGGWWSGG